VTSTGEPPRRPAGGDQIRQLDMPGLDESLRRDLDERITEFETLHQQDVMRGGEGWVPRVRRNDYLIAIVVNALIVLWLVVVVVGGE
jgi:hypothetical protein